MPVFHKKANYFKPLLLQKISGNTGIYTSGKSYNDTFHFFYFLGCKNSILNYFLLRFSDTLNKSGLTKILFGDARILMGGARILVRGARTLMAGTKTLMGGTRTLMRGAKTLMRGAR